MTTRTFETTPGWFFNAAPSLSYAALAYARVGVPVFPLQPRGKAPIVTGGLYRATTDPETIRAWWTRWPQANIGVPTGTPSGWWVLDIDPRSGGLESLEQLQNDTLLDAAAHPMPLSATRRQLTGGGGAHLVFGVRRDLEGGVQLHNAVQFAGYQGIDLRVSGGYIVVAPSLHQSGMAYAWQEDLPLMPFPDGLVERWCAHRRQGFVPRSRRGLARDGRASESLLRSVSDPHPDRPPKEGEPRYYLNIALARARVGLRHRYALYLACRLVLDVGLSLEEAVPWMGEYVHRVSQADHPYTATEALGCLEWAWREAA